MEKRADVIIIGAGPGGIFCAYELLRQKPDLKVIVIEKGRSIEKRVCPKRTTLQCVGCKPCSITTGFAGAGAFSDGKLSLSPDVGGNLPEILALILHKNPHARIVATAVTLESAAALTGCMKNFKSADCISMQVSKASAAGSYHLMKAQNPVWIFTLQNGGACS